MKLTSFIFAFLLTSLTILTQAQQKPNIIIIVSDDHAFQSIGAYGSKLMLTPNIDRIAKEGALFNKAYVTNSICGPSRAVILSGKYSHKNGFKDNLNPKFDGSQDIFVKRLQSAGYHTAWIGKWHLGTTPQGFDYYQILPGQGHYYNPDFMMMDGTIQRKEGYVTNLIEDAAEEYLDNRDTTRPFCLIIGHKATHRTWIPDTSDFRMFDTVIFPLPRTFYDDYQTREAAKVQDMTISKTLIPGYDLKMLPIETKDGNITRMNAGQRERFDAYYQPIQKQLLAQDLAEKELTQWKYQRYMRDYLATAASLDRNIGRTLNYLDRHGLTNNTIVIYISDQGFFLGEHGWFDKRFMYEESFRTPFIMRYPAVIIPGTIVNDFVLNLDIAPTVLDAAGLAIPDEIQGESILPLFKNLKNKTRETIYYHYYENGEHSVSPHFGIRTHRYKLIRFYKGVDSWELFDLSNDPDELQNLYNTNGYKKITADLKKSLEKQIEKYEDTEAKQIMNDND